MQKLFWILIFIVNTLFLQAQMIYVSDINGNIYELNLNDCSSNLLISTQIPITDIAFDQNGALYALRGGGELYQVDVDNGTVQLIHEFPAGVQIYNSMTIDAQGLIYVSGSDGNRGVLNTYNLNTNQEGNLGLLPVGASGDLTFYNNLLLAALLDDQIYNVNLENPAQSTPIIEDMPMEDIYGVVTHFENCMSSVYAITSDVEDTDNPESMLFMVDFENNQLIEQCTYPYILTGATTMLEYRASDELEIEEVNYVSASCDADQVDIRLIAAGGSAPYMYSLDGENYQADNLFENVPTGEQLFYVQDADGCIAVDTVSIESNGLQIDSIIRRPSCAQNNGLIEVQASNGQAPYTFIIGRNINQTGRFDSLSPGRYNIVIRDALGCESSLLVLLSSSMGPEIFFTLPKSDSCNSGDFGLEIGVRNGVPPYEYALVGDTFQQSSFIENLGFGEHEVIVRDAQGCTFQGNYFISKSKDLTLDELEIFPATCDENNGRIVASISGGIGRKFISLDGQSYTEDREINMLSDGNFTVWIKDDEQCIDTMSIELGRVPSPQINAVSISNPSCGNADGAVQVSAESGLGQLQYAIGEVVSNSNVLSGFGEGQYTLIVEDESGCQTSTQVEIVDEGCGLAIPNVFSPNNDGLNDEFELSVSAQFEGRIDQFQVFDRWGNRLFACEDVFNVDLCAWDGTFRGELMKAGVYTYQLTVVFPDGHIEKRVGSVTIVQ